MPVLRECFGHLQNGHPVNSIQLLHPDSGFAVQIIEYGARIRAIHVPVGRADRINTILGYTTLREYEHDPAEIGSVIGRCANRTVVADRSRFALTRNDGRNHLHGGSIGFGRSLWRTVSMTDGAAPRVELLHRSPDGHEGYRGNVIVRMELSLAGPFTLRSLIEATTDEVTPFNVTLHPYFNLSGDPRCPIEDHELRLASSHFLPLTSDQVPTGEIASVQDTPFDFRRPRRIGERIAADHPQLTIAGGYDHYWPIDTGSELAAELFSPRTGIRLQLRTDQKGLQFYAGNALGMHTPGHFEARAGLCLEPHGFPNALNEPRFPSIMLHPGETYRHIVEYAFSMTRTARMI